MLQSSRIRHLQQSTHAQRILSILFSAELMISYAHERKEKAILIRDTVVQHNC